MVPVRRVRFILFIFFIATICIFGFLGTRVASSTDGITLFTVSNVNGSFTFQRLRRSTACNGKPAPSREFSVVTALYDVGRGHWPKEFKRPVSTYMNYSVPMLQMHVPMIIFTEEPFVPFIEYYREGKEHMTKIITRPLQKLEYYRLKSAIENVWKSDTFKKEYRTKDHPEAFSSDYVILMNSKYSFMEEAAREHYFNAEYYYWMDAGYGHGGKNIFNNSDCEWAPRNIMNNKTGNKMTYVKLKYADLTKVHDVIKDYYKIQIRDYLIGPFFGGSRSAIHRHHQCTKQVIEEDFLGHMRIDDDQTINVGCYLKHPEDYNIVTGMWWDAFKLFH